MSSPAVGDRAEVLGRGSAWFRRLVVVGSSMLPTLEPGDRLLVVRSLRLRVGDLVALRDPEEPSRLLVKRLVAYDRHRVTVVGDNPGASRDSRAFGPVARASLVGRAVYRYYPPERTGPLESGGRRAQSVRGAQSERGAQSGQRAQSVRRAQSERGAQRVQPVRGAQSVRGAQRARPGEPSRAGSGAGAARTRR